MCGLAGLLHRDGAPVDPTVLAAMTAAIAHRGPDGEGIWVEGAVGLGHRRLAIRDLSPAGAQPFHSACGRVVVVHNGEIYNDGDVAAELSRDHGFVRRTRCDTEIVPAAYLAWGLDAFARLEGMFAIGLWDRAAGRLVLARDGAGIKPLFVADDGRSVRFGSELKALLADPAQSRALSPPDVAQMLALGYPAPHRSLLAGVGQLPPGTLRVWDREGVRERRIWRPARAPRIRDGRAALEAFVAAFPAVVRSQLASDVPVGVLQSGGIDSALIAMTLPKSTEAPLFCVRFAEPDHDETTLAAAVAAAAGRKLESVELDEGDAEADFRSVVRAVDGQLADASALAGLCLAREVRRRVKVALAGDGADEFFGGYPTYGASASAARLDRVLPRALLGRLAILVRRLAGAGESRIPPGEKLWRLLAGLAAPVAHAAWRQYHLPADGAAIYGPPLRALGPVDPLAAYAAAFVDAEGEALDRALLADQRFHLPADMLTKVDRTSMAFGLEVRVPFLDRRIMDLAGAIDARVLYPAGGPSKAVLRAALARFGGPPAVVDAPKRGFNVPIARLLRRGLAPLAERLLDREPDVLAPELDADGVRAVWRDQRDGRVDRKYLVWTLLTLAVWRGQLAAT